MGIIASFLAVTLYQDQMKGKHNQRAMLKICKLPILNMAGRQRQIIKMLIIDALILIRYKCEILNCHGGEEGM